MVGREVRPAAAAAAAFLALLASGGCRGAAVKPNILLVLIDTLRADHLHCYGYPRETSPALDELASRGALFEEAIAAAPWTLPSAMSLLTGRIPSRHRVENDTLRLPSSIPLLPGVLREAGYATSAVVSHIYVSFPFGFDRGFDHFDDFGLSRNYRFEAGLEPRATAVTDRALAQIRALKGRPFFLLVHYFDPHWDYAPPAPFDRRFAKPYRGKVTGSYQSIADYIDPGVRLAPEDRQHLLDLYDGEIAYADSEIGRLLRGLAAAGLSERTVVVVTSDHGEEFKEHNSMGHGRNLYDEVLKVPLIIAPPGEGRRARRIREQVRSIDLFPTLCRMAGGEVPSGVEGEDLGPLLSGKEGPSRAAVTETIRFDAYRKAFRQGGKKLILNLESNRRELYDLTKDPSESFNLWPERREEALAMEQDLLARVNMFSGGWNLRWSSDGRPHHFSGFIETEGLFTDVLPLFAEEGRHRVVRGRRLDFDLPGVTRGGGLCFRVDPPEARVAFVLTVDDREDPGRVRVGGDRAVPPTVPFSFGGPLRAEIFRRPPYRAGKEVAYFVWKNPVDAPGDSVELEDALRQRLRSLGYVR